MPQIELPNLYALVDVIDVGTDYWFVRTDSGMYFETYLENNFIGIGWNYITLEDLTKSDVEVKNKIAQHEGLDLSDSDKKRLVTTIYTKLLRFKNLAKGDRVVIPSSGSGEFGFGIVLDRSPYVDVNRTGNCEYYQTKKSKMGIATKDRST